jgi:V8-like Glu-specific endopeptidase
MFVAFMAVLELTVIGGVAAASASNTIPTATRFNGAPAVGAVFLGGTDSPHGCTGSVIRSPGRNLVLTSAHCLTGSGRGAQFVPGYHDGLAPYGRWDIVAAYVDPRWLSVQDPRHDYAFVVVAPQQSNGRSVQLGDVVAGNPLGLAPPPGLQVQVIAYPEGIDDNPITCTVPSYEFDGYPAFDCHGFVGGTSGAPWLSRTGQDLAVRGIIGGLHQGGCFEYTSYSSRFDQDTFAVYQRAAVGQPTDTLPEPHGDGC